MRILRWKLFNWLFSFSIKDFDLHRSPKQALLVLDVNKPGLFGSINTPYISGSSIFTVRCLLSGTKITQTLIFLFSLATFFVFRLSFCLPSSSSVHFYTLHGFKANGISTYIIVLTQFQSSRSVEQCSYFWTPVVIEGGVSDLYVTVRLTVIKKTWGRLKDLCCRNCFNKRIGRVQNQR